MKRLLLSLLFLAATATLSSQIVNIPDNAFKARLLLASTTQPIAVNSQGNYMKIDVNNNMQIEESEAAAVYKLTISSLNIASFTGIEAFENLTMLRCMINTATALDVSNMTNLTELYCYQNNITSLNLSGLSNLKVLRCESNKLTTLTLPATGNLETFNCRNNFLTTLNFVGFPNLTAVNCSNNNLTAINLTGTFGLTTLDCSVNALSTLSVAELSNLTELVCHNNNLSMLNLTGTDGLKSLNCQSNQLTSLAVSGKAKLQTLYCQYNNITALDVTGTILYRLECGNNQMTSLTLAGLPTLQYLYCNNNALSSLDLSGLTNLDTLHCNNNQITNLNIMGTVPLLQGLNCSYNALTSLTAQVDSWGYIYCEYNQLNTLSVIGDLHHLKCNNNLLSSLSLVNKNIESINCANNQLQTLNIAGTSFYGLNCSNNQLQTLEVSENNYEPMDINLSNNQLQSLFIKVNISDAELLTCNLSGNPGLRYICANAAHVEGFQQSVQIYGYDCEVNSYCSYAPGAFYTIKGNQRWDANSNGCQTDDPIFPNLKYSITNGSVAGDIISDHTGSYNIRVQDGTHTLTPKLENPGYFTVSPPTSTVAFPAAVNPTNQDFCITANGVHPDLEVYIIPIGAALPGFDALYQIHVKNKGTSALSGNVTFTFNDSVLDYMSANPLPTTMSTGTVSWAIANIQPFENQAIDVTLNLNSPVETPPLDQDDVLSFTVTGITGADETPSDNTFVLNQVVVNAFDPNDKTCLEGKTITPAMVGQYVHYMIRFENTGNYAAQFVTVKDVIDTAKFDVATLVPLEASHSFVTRINNGNQVEFLFENIQLPFDDANNDGFIVFKIKTVPTLALNSTFSNTAAIYFNYNAPVITNTETTSVALLGLESMNQDNFKIYPNPATNRVNIDSKSALRTISVFNILGQLVMVVPNAQGIGHIDVSALPAGNYLMKINSDKGAGTAKFIKK